MPNATDINQSLAFDRCGTKWYGHPNGHLVGSSTIAIPPETTFRRKVRGTEDWENGECWFGVFRGTRRNPEINLGFSGQGVGMEACAIEQLFEQSLIAVLDTDWREGLLKLWASVNPEVLLG